MIAFLQGVLTEKFSDRVELDVNGMGYEVFVSQKTLQSLPAAGKNVLLKTYLHVREDLLQLFGFLRDSEKQAFLLALSVSGIGPRAAMNILSAFAPEAFYQAILHNDLATLKSIPGIGQKTAQHVVLELKDKVTKLTGAGVLSGGGAFNVETNNISEAVQAMMALGYSVAESRHAVLAAIQVLGEKSTVEEILRSSLKSIAAP
ncbi:MAG TPA: Holliday junction branch migration protein RuvA [bacterium]|jgi:Holliday junction DNA helicase RuvA|nr:Holliday junction branch migration protein RuvA [bacterium]